MRRVKDLTEDELKSLIVQVVEDKLQDLLGDPDMDLQLRPEIRQRLHGALDQPPALRRIVDAAAVARRLGLEWQMYDVEFLPEAAEGSRSSGPPGPIDCGPRRQPWESGTG